MEKGWTSYATRNKVFQGKTVYESDQASNVRKNDVRRRSPVERLHQSLYKFHVRSGARSKMPVFT